MLQPAKNKIKLYLIMAMLLATSTLAITDGLVSMWDCSGSNGADSLGRQNGTATSVGDSRIGVYNACQFNRSGYITIADNSLAETPTGQTLIAFINRTSTDQIHALISHYNATANNRSYYLTLDQSGDQTDGATYSLATNNGGSQLKVVGSNNTVNASIYMVAASWGIGSYADYLRININGINDTVATARNLSYALPNSNSVLELGRQHYSAGREFNGSMIAMLWNRSLNDSELSEIYSEFLRGENLLHNETPFFTETFDTGATVGYGSAANLWTAAQNCSTAGCGSHPFRVDGSLSDSGVYSGRFEVRSTDPLVASGMRSELMYDKNQAQNKTYYLGFKVYIPADAPLNNNGVDWTMVQQFHADEDGCDSSLTPPAAIRFYNNTWDIQVANSSLACTTDASNITVNRYSIGNITLGGWTKWEIQVHWGYGSDGFIRYWKDDVLVLEKIGYVGYNDVKAPYLKTGIYKYNSSTTSPRIIYIDSLRYANENSSIDLVDPDNYETGSAITIENVSVNYSRQLRNITLKYSVQEKDRNAIYLSRPDIQQNILDTSTDGGHIRFWIAEAYTTNQSHTIPLLADCTTYNWTVFDQHANTIYDMGRQVHYTVAYPPDCMSNGSGAGGAGNDDYLPRSLPEYANYVKAIVGHVKTNCDNGTYSGCTFADQRFAIWNEAHADTGISQRIGYTNNGAFCSNFTKVWNATYPVVKATYPTAKLGTSSIHDPNNANYVDWFYSCIGSYYPDFWGMHLYDNGEAYTDTNLTTFLNGLDFFYGSGYAGARANKVNGYSAATQVFNYEYGLDYHYDSTARYYPAWNTNPWIDNQVGAVWYSEALLQQILGGYIDEESFFEGTDITSQPHYGLWNDTGVMKPAGLAKKRWVERFDYNETIYYTTTSAESLSLMFTADEGVLINKRNESIRVNLNLSNTSRNTLYGNDGLVLNGTGGYFTFSIEPLEVLFLDNSETTLEITDLQSPSQSSTWIYLNWTNPTSAEFNHAKLYNEGVEIASLTTNYYNVTGLNLGVTYNFTITPYTDEGDAGTSDTLSQATTGNNLPTVTAYISPYYVEKQMTIIGLFNATDEDNDDLVDYEGYWAINGVEEASFNRSSINESYCVQEQANQANDCGGIATPGTDVYLFTGTWAEYNTYVDDGDYTTYSVAYYPGSTATVTINYTKPTNASSATMYLLNIGFPATNYTTTVDNACFNADPTNILIRVNSIRTTYAGVSAECYNGSTYTTFFSYNSGTTNSAGARIYEEAMRWYFNSTPPTAFLAENPSNLSGSFEPGDNVTLYIRVNDGTNWSSYDSYSTIIASRPPVMVNVSINPTAARSNVDLFCYANATDVDGGSLTYRIQWYLNGVDNKYHEKTATQGVYTSLDNISADIIVENDVWTCGVTAFDGYNTSSQMNATVTISPDVITSPDITYPSVDGLTFNNTLNLEWDTAYSIGVVVTNYTVYLLNTDYTTYKVLATNLDSNNLSFNFYDEGIAPGSYILEVLASDDAEGLTSTSYRETMLALTSTLNVTAYRVATSEYLSSFNLTVTQGNTINNYTTIDGYELLTLERNETYNFTVRANGYQTSSLLNYYMAASTDLAINVSAVGVFNLTINFFDEHTNTQLGQTVSLDFISSYYASNYTAPNGTVSITDLEPVTYTMRYYASGYTTRFYTITVNTTDGQYNLTLYLVNSTLASNISVYVIDDFANPASNIKVKALKYDLSTNTYLLQEIGLTNEAGLVIMSLTKGDEYYKFMLERGEELLKITSPAYIYTDSLTIQFSSSEPFGEEYFNYNSINGVITYNPTTRNFRADYSDSRGLGSNYIMRVYSGANNTQRFLGSVESTSSSGTLLYTLDNVVNGTTYFAKLAYVESGIEKYLSGNSYTAPRGDVFGSYGLLIQIMFTIAIMVSLFFSPTIALIAVPLSLIIGNVIGLNVFSMGALVAVQLIGLLLAGVVAGRRG